MRVTYEAPRGGKCSLAFVGEAPGEDEVLAGRPFVGPSGQTFNAMLRTAGIDRSECLVTNVFEEKAEKNDVSPWLKDPTRLGAARLRLAEELSRFQPTVVVPLGSSALYALTGYEAISSYRGNVLQATQIGHPWKLVPTLHPAFVLRMWKSYTVVVGDLLRAQREVAKGPKLIWPTRRLHLNPDLADLETLAPALLSSDLMSLDIETGWGQITHIGLGWNQENALVVPFFSVNKTDGNYWPTLKQEVAAWLWVKRMVESKVPKLGQNFGAYDAMWLLAKKGIKVRNLLHDTRLLHHALYPELEKSLAFMGAAYSEQGAWKLLGRRHEEVGKQDD